MDKEARKDTYNHHGRTGSVDEGANGVRMRWDLNEQIYVKALKAKYGIKSGSELIRALLKKEYDQLTDVEKDAGL